VGKTSLVQHFITGKFLPLKRTVGADLSVYTRNFDNKINVKLQIWDFAGEAKYRAILPSYVKGASGCLLCYDITNYSSFYVLPEWYEIVSKKVDDLAFVLVGCKQDLRSNKHDIPESRAKEFARDHDISFFCETSSKLGHKTDLPFTELIKQILRKKHGIEFQ